MPNFLQPDAELQLHTRLLTGDIIAPADVAATFIKPLEDHLKFKYSNTDHETIWDAVTSALMDYIEHPAKYNPKLRSLAGYLKMAAEGDLNNALAKQQRKLKGAKIVRFDNVALLEQAGNIDIESESIARQEARDKLMATQTTLLTDNALDRQLLTLITAGERRTSEYATVLGITDLAIAEQKKIVKQHKDRLKLRLKRNQSG